MRIHLSAVEQCAAFADAQSSEMFVDQRTDTIIVLQAQEKHRGMRGRQIGRLLNLYCAHMQMQMLLGNDLRSSTGTHGYLVWYQTDLLYRGT